MMARSEKDRKWICVQLGARENYAIPRAFAARDLLAGFITDGWSGSPPWNWLRPVLGRAKPTRRFAQRFHPELLDEKVVSFNSQWIKGELAGRLWKMDDSSFHSRGNRDFDRLAARSVDRIIGQSSLTSSPPVVFAFANACLDVFSVAKRQGCLTVLGQFDPGPAESRIVQQECESRPEIRTRFRPYPQSYFDRWRRELELSDRIVVNSLWSRECLIDEGVDGEKIFIVPLADVPHPDKSFCREYPNCFSQERPLRILFLGQVILRKGIARLLDAAKLLQNESVEILLVGPTDIEDLPKHCRGLPIKYLGACHRDAIAKYYEHADVFILPTLSDGFALTQLEAQAWKLPIIASRRCGPVVKDGVNGILLAEPNGEAIAASIMRFLTCPGLLAEMSLQSHVPSSGLRAIAEGMIHCAHEVSGDHGFK